MSERLPLFPLGTVLLPGLVLPLHVFEDRYRTLVQDLLLLPEDLRQFGVVALREGREVGAEGATALHEVGCTALVRRVQEHPDGRYDLVTVGERRFRLGALSYERPYLVGEVEWLPDVVGDPAEARLLADAVCEAFQGYVAALAGAGAELSGPDELPDDPLVLSHLVAASVSVDLADRQALLAQPDGRARLRAELALLRRETVLLQVLGALPHPDLLRGPVSPN